MRCEYDRILSVIRQRLNREPAEGDVFIMLSKDHRKVRLYNKDDFDGTSGSLSSDIELVEREPTAPDTPTKSAKELRLYRHDMHISRMTLSNWLSKGVTYINGLVELLKDRCLEKDSIINCDETWCRVKVEGSYRKRYIWCLVNKLARTVIYCYDEGSCGRNILKHLLDNREVKALQSDGYNVYLYLDDKLLDINHLCCMAHVRAKFKYAFEQSGDKDAEYILHCMGELYGLERENESGLLSAEQIQCCRQGLKTKEIIIRLRSKLDSLLADVHPPRGDLMEKAVRYLHTFRNRLFAYLQDGCYSIDNSIAERFIRPPFRRAQELVVFRL